MHFVIMSDMQSSISMHACRRSSLGGGSFPDVQGSGFTGMSHVRGAPAIEGQVLDGEKILFHCTARTAKKRSYTRREL